MYSFPLRKKKLYLFNFIPVERGYLRLAILFLHSPLNEWPRWVYAMTERSENNLSINKKNQRKI